MKRFCKYMERLLLAGVLTMGTFCGAFAQTGKIAGSVREAENGKPMPFANVVLVKGMGFPFSASRTLPAIFPV